MIFGDIEPGKGCDDVQNGIGNRVSHAFQGNKDRVSKAAHAIDQFVGGQTAGKTRNSKSK